MYSEDSAKFTEKHLCWSLLIKKETPKQVFSWQFCEISQNTFSSKISPVVASVILLSWLRNHVKSQQQKNKVRFVGSLRGGIAGGSNEARSFKWFLGGFQWFVLVAGDIGWFQVVWCFSSYTIFTTYRRVISLLYWWTHVIDWGHSIFFIQSKTARKRSLLSCGLAVWK